jgi:hypothetical protein
MKTNDHLDPALLLAILTLLFLAGFIAAWAGVLPAWMVW